MAVGELMHAKREEEWFSEFNKVAKFIYLFCLFKFNLNLTLFLTL